MPASCRRTFPAGCVVASVADQLQRVVRSYGAQLMADGVDEMRRRIDEVTPRGKYPEGRQSSLPVLSDTWRDSGIRSGGSSFSAEIGYTAPQAKWTNEVMGPRVIVPRRAKALRFVTFAGDEVFAAKVNHPGNVNSPSLGWWDKVVTRNEWQAALQDKAGGRWVTW